MSKYTEAYKKFREFTDAHEERYVGFHVPVWIYEYLEQCESPLSGDRYGNAAEVCKDFVIQQLLDIGEISLAKKYWEQKSEELRLWLNFLEGVDDDDEA